MGPSASAFGSGDVSVIGGTVGALRVLGTFEQMAAGVLAHDFLGGGADLLDVADLATLGGGLDVSFEQGFATTGLYTLVSTASRLGTFASFGFDGLAAGYTASLVYSAGGVQISVTAVPEAGTWLMMLGGLAAVVGLRRRRRAG